MSTESLDRVSSVARNWEAACRSLDTDKILACLADDATVWYNFQPNVNHSKQAYGELLEASKKTFYNQRYKDMRIYFHPGGFVEQTTLEGDTANGVVETPFLLIAKVEGDRIARIEEYFDSSIMHKAGLAGG